MSILFRPIENCGANGAGLRYECQAARLRIVVAKRDIEPYVRTDDAKAIGPHQADAVAFGQLDDAVLQPSALGAGFAKAGREDQHHPMPRSPQASTISGMPRAGVATTTRSMLSSISSSDEYAFCP